MTGLTDAGGISTALVSGDWQLGLASVELWWETDVD